MLRLDRFMRPRIAKRTPGGPPERNAGFPASCPVWPFEDMNVDISRPRRHDIAALLLS